MPIGSTGAAIGGITSGIGGIANAFGVNNALSNQQSAYSSLLAQAQANPAGIFGSIPQYTPVDYTPLYQSQPGYAGIVSDVLKGNLQNFPLASNLTSQINAATSKDALSRIQGWDPTFTASLNQLQNNANAALSGNLPYSDALQIAGSRGQLANQLGMAGGSGPQTAADLGQTRESLMTQVGPSLLGQITSILNQVDPVTNQVNASSMLLSPSQGVQSAIGENQFGANFNFQQNMQEAMLSAMPDPQAQGLFNLAALQAGMAGQYNPSAGMALSSIGSVLQNPFVSGVSAYGSNPYFAASPYGANPFYTGAGGYPTTQQPRLF